LLGVNLLKTPGNLTTYVIGVYLIPRVYSQQLAQLTQAMLIIIQICYF